MIPRTFLVVKKQRNTGMIMSVQATFDVREKAQEWADNANEWYGEDHPLTPLVVIGDVLIEPPLFPVEALRNGGDIFADIDRD